MNDEIDVLAQMRARNSNPVLNKLREMDKLLTQVSRTATGQGDLSVSQFRLYADFSLSALGAILTIVPRESQLVSLYGDDGYNNYVLPTSITLDFSTGTSGKKHAIYLYVDPIATATTTDNAKISAEFEVWTNETTRATALVSVEGVMLKSGDNTRRWIGDAYFDGTYVYIQGGIDELAGRWYGTGDPNNMSGGTTKGYGFQVPGVLIGGVRYNSFTIKNDALQVGFNTDGALVAGAGAVALDADGIKITTFGILFDFTKDVAGNIQRGFLELLPDFGVVFATFGNAAKMTITDYNFNSGAFGSGWTREVIGGTAPTFETAHAFTGSAYSMKIDAADDGIYSNLITGLASGYQAMIEFWVYDNAVGYPRILIEYYNNADVLLGGAQEISIALEGSQTSRKFALLFPGVAPMTTAKAKIYLYCLSGEVYYQSVALYQGDGLMIQNGDIIGPVTFSDNVTMQGVLAVSGAVTGSNLSGTNTGDQTAAGLGVIPNSGWVEVSDTWTYASASTITVPTNATTTYQKGDYLRWKQGGGYKYGVITSLTATVITILINTDYTVASSAITDVAYSRSINPFGWPGRFNFSVTVTASGGGTITTYTVNSAYYHPAGNKMSIDYDVTISNIGTGTGTAVFTLPVVSAKRTMVFGRENAVTGKMLQALISAADTSYNVLDYANAAMLTNNYRYVTHAEMEF